MIRILDCKNPNYLSRLKLILNKRRFKSKINTDIVIKIVKDIKKNKALIGNAVGKKNTPIRKNLFPCSISINSFTALFK